MSKLISSLFQGRMSRLWYIVGTLVVLASYHGMADDLSKFSSVYTLLRVVGYFLWFAFSFQRLHDIGKSGWMAVVYLLPLLEYPYAAMRMLDHAFPHNFIIACLDLTLLFFIYSSWFLARIMWIYLAAKSGDEGPNKFGNKSDSFDTPLIKTELNHG